MKLFTSFIHSMLLSLGAIDDATLFCRKDVQVCPDFSKVARNPELDCDFDVCPVVQPPQCCADPKPSQCGRSGCHCCSDGEWLVGNSGPTLSPSDACAVARLLPSKPCASSPSCQSRDTKQCSDGSSVNRDPANDCHFKPCPAQLSSCPVCKTNRWTDGCNTCRCLGGKPACSKRFCSAESYLSKPQCLK